MYPNPAKDHVFIISSKDLKRVTVYNTLGQLMDDVLISGQQYQLNTTGYLPGMYIVRVENAAGVTSRALSVQK